MSKTETNEERDGVTFIWAIENFDDSWTKNMESPVFLSKSLDNTEWKLVLYPFGCTNNADEYEYISVSLKRCEDKEIERIIVDCELSLVNSEDISIEAKRSMNHGFKKGHIWFVPKFLLGQDVFINKKSEFLPSDTLTIRCRIWRRLGEHTDPEFRFLRTKIEKLSFVWCIKNVSSLSQQDINKIHIIKTHSEVPILTFNFFIEENGDADIKITSTEYPILESSYRISILDKNGKVFKYNDTSCSFGTQPGRSYPEAFVFPFLLNKSELLGSKNWFLPMDVLSLRVECFFWTPSADSNNVTINHIFIQNANASEDVSVAQRSEKSAVLDSEVQSSELKLSKFNSITSGDACNKNNDSKSHIRFLNDMQCMYEEGFLSDFKLRAGGKEFNVHKSILSARSAVFKAMFTSQMAETEGDSIEIPDVDSDTLQKMLLFVYSDSVDNDLKWESAMKLYFAADKYAIDDLKHASCSILKTGLCASNACEILVHADLHGDKDLKTVAKDFIVDHDGEIIGTEEWEIFQNDHIKLTVEVFNDLYIKKMKC